MNNAISKLQSCDLFNGLCPEKLLAISKIGDFYSCGKDEKISNTYCDDSELIILLSGSVIIKDTREESENNVISITSAVKVISLMPCFFNTRFLCEIVSLFPCQYFKINLDDLSEASSELSRIVRKRLLYIYGVPLSEKKECAKKKYIEVNSDQEKKLFRIENFFSVIILYLIVLGIINYIVVNYFPSADVNSPLFDAIYSFAVLIPLILYLAHVKLPFSYFGISKINLKESFVSGLITGFSLFLLVIFIRLLQNYISTSEWDLYTITNNVNLYVYIVYPVICAIQEFAARGVLQSRIDEFYLYKHPYFSIIMASAIFGFAHIHINLSLVFLTFLGGLFFGHLFHRYKNLIGPIVAHFIAGTAVIATGWLQ